MGGTSEEAYISDLRRALAVDDRFDLLSANGGNKKTMRMT